MKPALFLAELVALSLVFLRHSVHLILTSKHTVIGFCGFFFTYIFPTISFLALEESFLMHLYTPCP